MNQNTLWNTFAVWEMVPHTDLVERVPKLLIQQTVHGIGP
jgi:hypothetical protein